jgi:hypothetical protein
VKQGGGGDSDNPDSGIELQYNIAQGVNISIPVQKIAEVALSNAKNAAERRMNEMYEEANGGSKHYIDLSEEEEGDERDDSFSRK